MDTINTKTSTEVICEKCGHVNNQGSNFCLKCGAPIHSDEASSQSTETGQKDNIDFPHGSKLVNRVKKIPAKVIGIAVGAVAILITVICIAINVGKTINLDKYLTFEEEGYDGYGRVKAVINWDAIEEKYGKKVKYTRAAKKELNLNGEDAEVIEKLYPPMKALNDCVSVELEQRDKATNGQTINYKWNIDEDAEKYLTCKLKFKDGSYTVSGLKEVEAFDIFDSVTVIFSGIAPNGQANLEYSGNEIGQYDIELDKTYALKNGDMVKAIVRNQNPEYYAEKLGKIPVTFEKSYTVEGLDEYISDFSDLTEDFLATLKTEAEDSIYAYAASNYGKSSSLGDIEYSGYILNSIKNGDSWGYSNILYIIYSGLVSNQNNDYRTQKVYFPVEFANILKTGSGLSYENKNGIKGYSTFTDTWYGTNGYTNPIVCYSELVEANRDNYNTECGDGFEIFSDYELIASLDDMDDELKDELNKEAEDIVLAYTSNKGSSWSPYVASNLHLVGEYLLIAKTQGIDFKNNNKYIIVYAADVSTNKETVTVYYPVEFDGIVTLPTGEVIVTADKGIQGQTSFEKSWDYTKGYFEGSEMFSAIVTANRDKYTYEVSDGLKEFGE